MANHKRIPIPLSRRIRHLRGKLVPLLVFSGAVTLTVMLWMRHSVMPNSWGAVEAIRYDLGSHIDGTLVWNSAKGEPQLFQQVIASEVIAMLDPKPTLAALDVVKAESRQLESQLAATLLQAKLDQDDRHYERNVDARRMAVDIERLKLELLDRDAMIASDRIDVERRDEKIKLTEELVSKGSQAEFELFTERMRRDIVTATIAGNEKARAEAAIQLKAAQDRAKLLPQIVDPEFELLLKPIKEGQAVLQARMTELEVEADALKIRSPIAGTITAIFFRPGQAVRAGQPILTVGKEVSPRIIAYIRPNQRIDPKPDMTVTVRARSNPTLVAQATVDIVGPQFESIPIHHLVNPAVPEVGLPVSIHLPSEFKLRPGEIVDLTFRR